MIENPYLVAAFGDCVVALLCACIVAWLEFYQSW